MAIHNNVKLLLFICCNVAISFHLATSQLPPESSPSPQTHISLPPTLSPSQGPAPEPVFSPWQALAPIHVLSPLQGPAMGHVMSPTQGTAPRLAPTSHVSYPPSIFDSSSESISPTAEGPSTFDYLLDFDISPTPSSFDTNPMVKEICASTDYPSLCIVTVAPHLNEKPDLMEILQVSVKAEISIARQALLVAQKIAEKPEDPDLAMVLHDCKNVYDNVVRNFENALRAFTARDIGTMNSMFSIAITDIGDCEDALNGVGARSPLSDYADKLIKITNNCLAIVSLMN